MILVSKDKSLFILTKNLPSNSGLFSTSSCIIVILKNVPTPTPTMNPASGPRGVSSIMSKSKSSPCPFDGEAVTTLYCKEVPPPNENSTLLPGRFGAN